MESIWLDRDLADRLVAGVDWDSLTYDPDTGLNCFNGEPFTGASKTRQKDGRLQGLTHYKGGVAHGVSIGWYPSGQISVYSEMEDDVYHGLHIEWNEDGTKRTEERYLNGRLVKHSGSEMAGG
jgi:hypothetical protein